jgi:hypothetical protein
MFCKLSLYIRLNHQNPEIISHRNMNFNVAQYIETVREKDDGKWDCTDCGEQVSSYAHVAESWTSLRGPNSSGDVIYEYRRMSG